MIAPFRTASAVGYSLIEPGDMRTATDTNVYHGLQPSGRYLSKIDLDNHTAGQDADAARAAFECQFPNIAKKVDWRPSEGKRGRPGWHGYVETNKPLPH